MLFLSDLLKTAFCITGEGWVSEYSNNIESLGAKFAERSILLKTRILTLSIKVG